MQRGNRPYSLFRRKKQIFNARFFLIYLSVNEKTPFALDFKQCCGQNRPQTRFTTRKQHCRQACDRLDRRATGRNKTNERTGLILTMSDELISDIPFLDSVQDIAGNYDAWLVDLWGVMHNGVTAIEPAIQACERYRSEGGIIILLSNAPRPQQSVRAQIEGYGVPSSVDDGIVTSGDVTRFMLASNEGGNFHFIGPRRDRTLFEGLNINIVGVDQADAVLLTGLYDDTTETPESYRGRMNELLELDLPMICANPDIKVERGDEVIYAGGAIAALYEEMGGKVVYGGKPYRPIYDLAMRRINELAGREIPPERILAIGDGVNTDIKGAVGAHIDPLFIPSGVHVEAVGVKGANAAEAGKQMRQAVAALFRAKDFRPIACQRQLQW